MFGFLVFCILVPVSLLFFSALPNTPKGFSIFLAVFSPWLCTCINQSFHFTYHCNKKPSSDAPIRKSPENTVSWYILATQITVFSLDPHGKRASSPLCQPQMATINNLTLPFTRRQWNYHPNIAHHPICKRIQIKAHIVGIWKDN